METQNKIELTQSQLEQKSAEELNSMCHDFATLMTKPKTWIKCEIDAQNQSYESVRAEIEKIFAEHEGKRELQITIKKLSVSKKLSASDNLA